MAHRSYGRYLVQAAAWVLIILVLAVIYFIASKGLTTFFHDGINFFSFLFSTHWNPSQKPDPSATYGSLVFIAGSMTVTALAAVISTPLSVSAALYMTEIAPELGQRFLKPAIEIFVGIPSVVYGWTGVTVLVPFIREHFGGNGFSLLSGGIVLSIMILPTITTVAADSIGGLPNQLKQASFGLGATRWQTIYKVLLPAAMPGILTGVVLGIARAFGEALAIQMVTGNMRVMPSGFLNPIITLTSGITMDMGTTALGSTWNNALWSMALVLLIMTMLFILVIRRVGKGGIRY